VKIVLKPWEAEARKQSASVESGELDSEPVTAVGSGNMPPTPF
jgi:hypothetical protein